MSIDIEDIKEKVLLVNISDTHYLNREKQDAALGELSCASKNLSDEKKIQGAAQCFWLLNKNKIANCKYVFAVAKGKVYGVFKLDEQKKYIEAEGVVNEIDKLKQKGQYVNYPPYRDIEIEAHTYDNWKDIKAMENDPNINKELFKKAIERIPIKNGKISDRWFKRIFPKGEMNMKKVISYILCVCLIITLFSGAGLFSVSAATYSGTCGDNVTWSYDASTYTLTISGTDEMSNYSHSYNSAGTSAPWSQYYNTIKSLIIEDSVTSIGGYAFRNHTGLTSVTIPDSITSIGNYAFEGCTRLKKVNYIGDIANWCKISFAGPDSNPLYYAHNLYINDELVTDLIIPNSVTSISNYAFCSCTGLTSITIPDSVTEIGGVAFYGCTGLTSITIPDSVTSIGYSAFAGCTGFTSITIPDSVTSIGSSAFSGCTGLTSITIPDSITSIGKGAFYNCTGLTSITIPDSITSIGDYAFSGCTRLTSVYYIGEKQQQAQMSIGYHGNDCLLNTNWYYVSLINAKQADCTETGYTGDKVLQETGEIFIYGKEIPALGHDYNTVVTNPTCTAQGYTTHTCSRCNDSYKDDYTYMPCGENCGFIIEDNTLYIYGTGNTDNYKTQTFVPWHDYADSITEIVIDEGITKVGNYAFYCLENVKSIKSKNIDLAFGKYSINDSNTGITVFAENGGTLETYCAENGINYVDPTITPELETVTDNSITVKAVGGYEYSKDGKTWQNSNEFTALSPASEYTIYARYAATADMFDTVGTPLIVTTLKLAVSAPAAPDYQNHTDNSITLIPNDLYEYSIDGENWQKSSEFTGLEKNAIYRFYQRVAETETEYASEPSAALIIAIPDKPQIVRTTTEKITVKRIEGFEYCLDDMVWQNSNVFDKLIDNEEYTIYQRLKAVDGERVYQIVSEPTATLTVNSGAIPGDINGDGSVNNKDLTRLFQYLSDWDVEVNVDALDVNGDGNVNNKDLTRLFQYLSDWDVQIF